MSETKIQKRYYNEDELEVYSGIRKRTLQRKRLLGQGPPFCKFGGSVRYDVRKFDEWAAEQAR